MTNYRDAIVKGYRERLLKVLVKDDLVTVFRDLGETYPNDALQARYDLLREWSPEIERLVTEIIRRNIQTDTELG